MGCPAIDIANPKRASRAIPAPARRASAHGPVSLRRTKEKRHRYGWTASSGSYVANDPVNKTDPTGMIENDSWWKKAAEVCRLCLDVIGALDGNPPEVEDIPERPAAPADSPTDQPSDDGKSRSGSGSRPPRSPGSNPPPVVVPRPERPRGENNESESNRSPLAMPQSTTDIAPVVVGGAVIGTVAVGICVVAEPCGAIVFGVGALAGLGLVTVR